MKLPSWNIQWGRGMDGRVDRPACFDIIFITEDIAPRLKALIVDAETKASDHQPVWVELND